MSTLPELMKAHEDFYSSLFAEEPVDVEMQNNLLTFVSRRLLGADCEVCKEALLLDKANEALSLSNRNKPPGPDDLSVKFYLTFWLRLGPLLVDVFNEGITSITHLGYKKDDQRNLKNWHPIPLLNVDYKIWLKAISSRLSKVWTPLSTQTRRSLFRGDLSPQICFCCYDTLDHIERTSETGILVSLDQESFQSCELDFSLESLRAPGLRPFLIELLLYPMLWGEYASDCERFSLRHDTY